MLYQGFMDINPRCSKICSLNARTVSHEIGYFTVSEARIKLRVLRLKKKRQLYINTVVNFMKN